MLPYTFELAGYCEHCPYFSAAVEGIETTAFKDIFPKVDYVVSCTHKDKCGRVAHVLSQELIGNGE